MGVEPQYNGLVLLAEFGQRQIPMTPVFALPPLRREVRPMRTRGLIRSAGAEIGLDFVSGRQRPRDETMEKGDSEIGEVRLEEIRDQPVRQDQRLHTPYPLKTKRAPKTSA